MHAELRRVYLALTTGASAGGASDSERDQEDEESEEEHKEETDKDEHEGEEEDEEEEQHEGEEDEEEGGGQVTMSCLICSRSREHMEFKPKFKHIVLTHREILQIFGFVY